MRTFYLLASIIILAAFIAPLATVQAARPPFVFPAGCCYYNGEVVRTVIPPSAFPNEGRDNFYMITNGVSGQKPVVAVAPGDIGYHGGMWAVYIVTFKEGETPSLLTSATAVLAAQSGGDVTITRARTMDFLCPIQL